jgi:hypothetical protein
MSRSLFGLMLAVCGGYLLHEGWLAAHSLTGTMDYYSKGIAYKIGGHVRLPGFVITFVGGALFILAAWWVLRAEGSASGRKFTKRKRRG